MKQIPLCTIYLLLAATTAFGQAAIQIPSEDTSNFETKTWGTDSVEQGVFLIPDGDSFMFTGVTHYNRQPKVTFHRVGQDMEVKWTKVLMDDHYRFPYSGTRTKDGNFIFCGFIRKKGSNHLDGMILKTDSSGDTIWTVTYGGPKEERLYDVRPTQDKNYLLIGNTASAGNGKQDGLVIKINEAGKVLWSKTFGDSGLDKFYNGVELENGDFIVSGIKNDNYPQNSDMYLVKIDRDGNTLWEKVIATGRGEFPSFVSALGKDELFVAGHTLEKSDSLGGLVFMHLNAAGEVIQKSIVQTAEDIKLENGILTKSGEFLGIGFTRRSTKTPWKVVLVNYNIKTGKSRFRKIELSESNDEVFNIQRTGKYYFLAGQTMKRKGDNLLIKWKAPK